MRPSKVNIEVTVKNTSEEYKRLSELLMKFGGDKSGAITVNGIALEVYSMDVALDCEYGDYLTFKIETKSVHSGLLTNLLESIYSESL